MRTKLGLLTAFYAALMGFQAAPATDEPILEMRLVYEAPEPGREAREHEGETLHLGPVLLSDSDLIAVRPSTRSGQLRLVIGMTEEAAERLFESTSDHVARRLAVLLDGRIRAVTNMRGPLGKAPDTVLGTEPARGWQADIDVGPAGEDDDGLVQRIRARWPVPEP